MTLPQNVADAVRHLEIIIGASPRLPGRKTSRESLQTIRAELTRLTEIAEGVDPLVVRLGEVTTRLEAANALLREALPWVGSECSERHVSDLVERIEAHLSEPRT